MKRYLLIIPASILLTSLSFAGPSVNLQQTGSQLADIKIPGALSLPTAPQFGIKNVKPSASGCSVAGLNPSSGPWENSPCSHIYGATRIIPSSTGTGTVNPDVGVLNQDVIKSE
jgi:hypothetical protein